MWFEINLGIHVQFSESFPSADLLHSDTSSETQITDGPTDDNSGNQYVETQYAEEGLVTCGTALSNKLVECQTCLRLRVGYILGMKYRAF